MSNQTEENIMGGYEPEQEATHSLYDEKTQPRITVTIERDYGDCGNQEGGCSGWESVEVIATDGRRTESAKQSSCFGTSEAECFAEVMNKWNAGGTVADAVTCAVSGGLDTTTPNQTSAVGDVRAQVTFDEWYVGDNAIRYHEVFAREIWQAALASQPKVTEAELEKVVFEAIDSIRSRSLKSPLSSILSGAAARAILARFPWIKGV